MDWEHIFGAGGQVGRGEYMSFPDQGRLRRRFLPQLNFFLIPPILCCCFWMGGRRKMWDMGYEDEHLLVRHYPWVNNPLRAWAQCRRPQELITFF